jgi:hypothetical protein
VKCLRECASVQKARAGERTLNQSIDGNAMRTTHLRKTL